MKIGIIIQGYEINALANGYVLAKSPTAPSPYAVWQIDDDGTGVCCGHYFVDREEAEWDFCARAFEWFEDNMYIHMIEDDRESNAEQPLDRRLLSGLREIREVIASASQLVDEMCAEVDRLQDERRRLNGNDCNDND